MITSKSIVTFLYTARDIDGTLLDATPVNEPYTVRLGEGSLPEELEKGLLGLKVGDKKKIILTPEKIFGEYLKENVLEIPRSYFSEDEPALKIGNYVELKDAEGNVYRGNVLNINSEHYTIDFNHPLAGKTIEYDIEIVSIQD
jgi:FKBP-type peptidyl-prolyl cis-trans isomerase 2